MTASPLEILQNQITRSDCEKNWFQTPFFQQDIWSFTVLGYTEEELAKDTCRNLYFTQFQIPWLKFLAKLTALVQANERMALTSVRKCIRTLRCLDSFLSEKGYSQTSDLTNHLLQEFIAQGNSSTNNNEKKRYISYSTKLWAEEDWLKTGFVTTTYDIAPKNVEIVPEEVLIQVYENFDIFPSALERLFRLQLALGWRIGAMLSLPRWCLKQEENQWFIQQWIEKRKIWKFYPIHFMVAELVQAQQHFLNEQFGLDSAFDKLFCWMSAAPRHGAKQPHRNSTRFEIEPVYKPKPFNQQSIGFWLREFSKSVQLTDKYGVSFTLTSHMFRRTKASIMAYCDTEDEYIAAMLGHASLDMLPHYRSRSLERLEKESKTKGYVDMYGRITTFKPKKRRYEKLAELMKVTTPLGECHRPKMLGDCQYRYACLRCDHHRVTPEDRAKLEDDLKNLHNDLEQAKFIGAERRVTEITQLKKLIENRLGGLNELTKIY